jgi:glucosamine-6-phosphate deaminase
VVVFSPHPDDDVIGMGGTIARLVQHGHRVHLAVQTSGHRGVSDADLAQYLAYVEGFTQLAGADGPGLAAALARTRADAGLRREARLLLRRTETDAAAARCGVERAFIHHLDLPFYEQVDGLPGKADAERILALLDELQPHQIYAAGDLGDPHGTHRRCLEVLASALDMAADRPWRKRLHCWLYRGAWDAWPPEAVDRAVPLTEADLLRKRQAIIRHQSQKDTPPFPGDDVREFWQRAEDRARAAAESYDRLGLPHYQAMETFAAWDGVTLP